MRTGKIGNGDLCPELIKTETFCEVGSKSQRAINPEIFVGVMRCDNKKVGNDFALRGEQGGKPRFAAAK
jgi:hypothetical protein